MKPHLTTPLDVDGMSCASCVRHVTAALALPGIDRVDVQLESGYVVINHDASQAPVVQLIRVLADAGYVARPRAGHRRP